MKIISKQILEFCIYFSCISYLLFEIIQLFDLIYSKISSEEAWFSAELSIFFHQILSRGPNPNVPPNYMASPWFPATAAFLKYSAKPHNTLVLVSTDFFPSPPNYFNDYISIFICLTKQFSIWKSLFKTCIIK